MSPRRKEILPSTPLHFRNCTTCQKQLERGNNKNNFYFFYFFLFLFYILYWSFVFSTLHRITYTYAEFIGHSLNCYCITIAINPSRTKKNEEMVVSWTSETQAWSKKMVLRGESTHQKSSAATTSKHHNISHKGKSGPCGYSTDDNCR